MTPAPTPVMYQVRYNRAFELYIAERHESEKLDPDRYQNGLDPQHGIRTVIIYIKKTGPLICFERALEVLTVRFQNYLNYH